MNIDYFQDDTSTEEGYWAEYDDTIDCQQTGKSDVGFSGRFHSRHDSSISEPVAREGESELNKNPNVLFYRQNGSWCFFYSMVMANQLEIRDVCRLTQTKFKKQKTIEAGMLRAIRKFAEKRQKLNVEDGLKSSTVSSFLQSRTESTEDRNQLCDEEKLKFPLRKYTYKRMNISLTTLIPLLLRPQYENQGFILMGQSYAPMKISSCLHLLLSGFELSHDKFMKFMREHAPGVRARRRPNKRRPGEISVMPASTPPHEKFMAGALNYQRNPLRSAEGEGSPHAVAVRNFGDRGIYLLDPDSDKPRLLLPRVKRMSLLSEDDIIRFAIVLLASLGTVGRCYHVGIEFHVEQAV